MIRLVRTTRLASPSLRVGIFASGLCAVSCGTLTREEAKEAVEEAEMYSQAVTLIGTTVEITENFSIGSAVEAAAENLRDFYLSQLPCADVMLSENTLSVEYGATGEDCEFRGMTFTGIHEVTISQNDMDQIVVDHVWTEIENGEMEVSGSAQVTWTGGDDPSRRVVHDLMWTRLSDGREAEGRGDRVQQPLDGDITLGFTVSGDAVWEGRSGAWDLTIDDVEMRWRDPVPQAGSYFLETPFDKDLTLSYLRVDERTVEVSASSGRRHYEFDVTTPE